MFILAKSSVSPGSMRFVISIKRGGLSIESGHYCDLDPIDPRPFRARKWASRAAAEKAKVAMAEIGGPHDYEVCGLAEMPEFKPHSDFAH